MIRRLSLCDFRNYESSDIRFESKFNLFIGGNGQGKTNILEAVFFLAMLRSFRASGVRSLRRIGSSGFRVSASVDEGRSWDTELDISYGDRRELRVDGVMVRRASEFVGRVRVVAFSPSDIMLVTESSSIRRRFLNMFVSSYSPAYLASLSEYGEALAARNAMLRAGNAGDSEFSAFESILAERGSFVVGARGAAISALSEAMSAAHAGIIGGGGGGLSLRHQFNSATMDSAVYADKLAADRVRDAARGATSCGPHLDDFEFLLEGRSLRGYGSTGQCRLAALCLKMAAVEALDEGEGGGGVVTLVDDVTGELDAATKNAFLRVLDRSRQSFLTFTERPADTYLKGSALFQVERGTVRAF
jgi:DNA replication and repair protein RecF